MKKNCSLIATLLQFAMVFILSGCLEESAPPAALDLQNPVTYFEGISSVKNRGGFPISIEITWTPTPLASKYRIYAVTRHPVTGLVSFNLIEEISDSAVGTYFHRDSSVLNPGQIYTYRVNAVDYLGQEDGNLKQLSTVAFPGLDRVEILSKTSARVFLTANGSFAAFQVTAHPTRFPASATAHDVVKRFNSSDTNLTLEGLRPGTNYTFNATVEINDNGDPDGNEVGRQAQTISDSFGSGDSAEAENKFQYRNVRLVQAFGDAPNELNRSANFAGATLLPPDLTEAANPHKRTVKIIPNPFSVVHTGKYRVIRIAGVGNTLPSKANFDTTITTVCQAPQTTPQPASATATACIVCDHLPSPPATDTLGQCDIAINSIPPTFIDKALDPPPRKYFYTITKVQEYTSGATVTKWPEELPAFNYADFTFAAHVPEDYMVLVQRDSVNYETCRMLNKSTNPRKNNRCIYNGIAAYPRDTGGNEIVVNPDPANPTTNTAGFYDFGYNIFVDRHALACNWTRTLSCDSNNDGVNDADCFSFGATAGGNFQRESGSNINPPSSPLIPVTDISNVTTYVASPTVLFNTQDAGNNCYAAYFSNATLSAANADPATTLANTSIDNAEWTSVGRLAEIAFNANPATQLATINALQTLVRGVATADPGPIGGSTGSLVYTDRKRPVITGLSNVQAQALCSFQKTSNGRTKRLMRRREFLAASSFSSTPGEPGYTTQTELNNVVNGNLGQTLYVWNNDTNFDSLILRSEAAGSYGDGTVAGINRDAGGCGVSRNDLSRMTGNPQYCTNDDGDALDTCGVGNRPFNNVIPKLTTKFCNNSTTPGCAVLEVASGNSNATQDGGFVTTGLTIDQLGVAYSLSYGTNGGDYRSHYLDPRNENAGFALLGQTTGNGASNSYFIGSLATNRCKSRFGLQDPFATSIPTTGGGIRFEASTSFGFYLSDTFAQTNTGSMTTTSPVFQPVPNPLDQGVLYDYQYPDANNPGTLKNVLFSNDSQGYSPVAKNGNATGSCPLPSGQPRVWYTDNYYYYTVGSTINATTTTTCNGTSGNMQANPRRDNTDITGFSPILGIPFSQNVTALNGQQDKVDFNNYLFANQFSDSPNSQGARARFYSTGTNTVNMTTGIGSRWSFELSEPGSTNNAGMAWCAVEAE